jgi:hypothetical protein
MQFELSDLVRAYAQREHVETAKREGRRRFEIRVRDLHEALMVNYGFPRQNVPQVCSALRSKKFLRQLGLEIERVDGPPSKTSTTVVFHYRFRDEPPGDQGGSGDESRTEPGRERSPQDALARMRGLMREEFAAYGGGEAFLKWLRTDPEKDRR